MSELTYDRATITADLLAMLEDFDATLEPNYTKLCEKYSPRNVGLILLQCPEATDVAGFKTWLSAGRSVQKGQKGIRILAPVGGTKAADVEEADEKKVVRRFRWISVFDVTQTAPIVK